MTPQDQIYSLPTNVGAAKLAYALANQLTVNISHMAIGDGNGAPVNPTSAATALVREVHRAQLNQLYQHQDNANWLVAELVLPAEVGGWTIREIGLYDVDGELIFVGNHAEQYKPIQSQGSDETKTVRMVILVSSVAAVTLKTDPTTVMATVDYVQRELAKLDQKQSVRYATTAAVVLSGLGVQAGGDWASALTAGDRVLVKNQASAKDNGIYVVAGGAWVRSADADISAEVTPGMVVTVEQGSSLADTRWQLVTDGVIVLGTTLLTFQNVTQGYAPLASPAMTGNPTAPTPAQFDNDARLATTEFVQRALGSKRGWIGINANTALSSAHVGAAIGYLTGSTVTATLPAASGLVTGASISFYNNTSVDQLVAAAGADTIAFGSTANGGAIGSGFTIPPGCTATFVAISGAAWHAAEGTATLSGTKQPTPPQFDASQKLATMEALQRALGNYAGQNNYSVSTVLTAADAGKLVVAASGATITLPLASQVTEGVLITVFASVSPIVVQKQGADTLSAQGGELGPFTLPANTFAVFRRLKGGGGWSLDDGDFALKYSPMFAGDLSATPSQKLPSGWIIKTGGVVATVGGTAVTFPIEFPNACLRVVMGNNNGSSPSYGVSSGPATKTGFTAYASSGSVNGNWIAIGY